MINFKNVPSTHEGGGKLTKTVPSATANLIPSQATTEHSGAETVGANAAGAGANGNGTVEADAPRTHMSVLKRVRILQDALVYVHP